ncbi:hypothetical protein NRK68_17515 [Streptomyces yangpuensis]|uniref:Uncharacterized protein n=1 Tax=Streptomyces yangpuensis TaxID=1648182 RepID=A0ABY5PXS0_9ACTN|nr:hypothetical protein [Streptomyces yangpuensis]UUY48829.1 hypothetical protein NRK68_17515 [Streptomyces yangpuensis]
MNDAAPAPTPAPRRARVRAPELISQGGWINTGGKDLKSPICEVSALSSFLGFPEPI